jgi:ABC-type uncharacterized transport system substrate-binding protein
MRLIGIVLALLLTVAPLATEGQTQTGTMWRIGVLQIGSPTDASSFRQALHDLGYVEGRNIVIESRTAEGRLNRLADLAAELVHLKVDVIVASGVAGTRAAKEATGTIPIVMLATDPLGAGLIGSLAKPGGNITGVATLESELGAKRLEHFNEAFPTATRVTVLYDPMTSATVLKEMEDGARRLKVELQVLEVRGPEDLDGSFKKATRWRAAALSILASPFFQSQRVRIAKLAVEHRLPTMVPHRAYVSGQGTRHVGQDKAHSDQARSKLSSHRPPPSSY